MSGTEDNSAHGKRGAAAPANTVLRRFILIGALIVLARILVASSVPLFPDEAYHWEWSRHLALGYYDHPPMTAYVIWLSTHILGDTVLGVRFGAIVLLAAASFLMYKLGEDITGDARVAFWSGMSVNVIPLLSVFHMYMSTDPPTIFFWALSLWLVYRAVFLGKKRYWYYFGFALGGALVTKFLNVLFVPTIGLFLICSSRYRRLLLSKEPYLAGLIAFIITVPFLYWNATHDWATFSFNLSRRHTFEASPLLVIQYFLGQFVAISPFYFVGFLLMSVRSWRKGLREKDELHLFFATTGTFMFLFFLLFSALRPIGVHWPAAGYLSLCVAMPHMALVENNIRIQRYARRGILTAVLMLIAPLSLLIMAALRPGVLAPTLEMAGLEPDTAYLLYGYDLVAEEAERRAQSDNAILVTPSYASTSMLSFYTPSQVQVHMFGKGSVHGLNYRYWDEDFSSSYGRDAWWVHRKPPTDSYLEGLQRSFGRVSQTEAFAVMANGKPVRHFYFVHCQNLRAYEME